MNIVLSFVNDDNVSLDKRFWSDIEIYLPCIYSALFVIFFLGCTSSGYLNAKKHRFSQKPQNIIMTQIDGLGVTHMGALRFGIQNDQDVDYLSSFTCSGVAWPQNFYTMRPNAFNSMNAQIIGSKSIEAVVKILTRCLFGSV